MKQCRDFPEVTELLDHTQFKVLSSFIPNASCVGDSVVSWSEAPVVRDRPLNSFLSYYSLVLESNDFVFTLFVREVPPCTEHGLDRELGTPTIA